MENDNFDNIEENFGSKPNIYIFGLITEKTSEIVVHDLIELSQALFDRKIPKPEIFIYLNTDGGDLGEMYAIFDAIQHVKNKGIIVNTVGLGKVMSAGLVLLAAGSKNCRKVGKNTRLMFHQISTEYNGNLSELKIDVAETDFVQNQYVTSLIECGKQKKEFWKKILNTKTDYFFSPNEAIQMGIADSILDQPNNIKKPRKR